MASLPLVAVILGTRPEAIKLAPVIQALRASPHLRTEPILTGKHREMVDQVMRLFGRSARDPSPVCSRTHSTRCQLARINCHAHQGWWGERPRLTNCRTVSPAGIRCCCGKRANCRATCFGVS